MSPQTHLDYAVSKGLESSEDASFDAIKRWVRESLGEVLPLIKSLDVSLDDELSDGHKNTVKIIINTLSKINPYIAASALSGADPSVIKPMTCGSFTVRNNLRFSKISLVSDTLFEKIYTKPTQNVVDTIRSYLSSTSSAFYHTTLLGIFMVDGNLTILVPASKKFPSDVYKFQIYAARLIATELKTLSHIVGSTVTVKTISIESKTLNAVINTLEEPTHIDMITDALMAVTDTIETRHIHLEPVAPLTSVEINTIHAAKSEPVKANSIGLSGAALDSISNRVFEISKSYKESFDSLVLEARKNLPSNVAELSNLISKFPDAFLEHLYNRSLVQLTLIEEFGFNATSPVILKSTKELFIELIALSESQGRALQPINYERIGGNSMDMEIH